MAGAVLHKRYEANLVEIVLIALNMIYAMMNLCLATETNNGLTRAGAIM